MVWLGITALRKSKLIFVPAGSKINADTFQTLILDDAIKNLGSLSFQQDRAPSHTANFTKNSFKSKNVAFFNKSERLLSSPDLNSLDFCVWSIFKAKVCAVSHTNFNSLRRALVQE